MHSSCGPIAVYYYGRARHCDVPGSAHTSGHDTDYLSFLLAFPHYVFSFLLRSRAATAFFAISRRLSADRLAALAFPPLLEILVISDWGRFAALAFPPSIVQVMLYDGVCDLLSCGCG